MLTVHTPENLMLAPNSYENNKQRWEKCVISYQENLDTFYDKLPSEMKRFLENVPVQGAVLLQYGINNDNYDIKIRILNSSLRLVYKLSDTPTAVSNVLKTSKGAPRWLYDELKYKKGIFYHNIITSKGILLTIPFSNFKLQD